jgi:hypothetical protein
LAGMRSLHQRLAALPKSSEKCVCKDDKWGRLPLFDELHNWDRDLKRPSKGEAEMVRQGGNEVFLYLAVWGFMSNPKKTVCTSIKDFPLGSKWLSYFFLPPDRLEHCWKRLISEGPDWAC